MKLFGELSIRRPDLVLGRVTLDSKGLVRVGGHGGVPILKRLAPCRAEA